MSNNKLNFPSLRKITSADLDRTPQIDSDAVSQSLVRDIPVPGERDSYTLAYYELLSQFDRDVPYHGDESDRPDDPQQGFTFFNTDTKKYEKYNGTGSWETIGGIGTPESPLNELHVAELSAGNIEDSGGNGGGGGFDDSVIEEIEQTANDAQESAQQARQRVGNLAESIENVDSRVSSFESSLESVQQTAQTAQQQAQLSRDRASDAFEEVARVESESVAKAGDTMKGDLDFDGQYDVVGVDTLDVNSISGSVSIGSSSVDTLTAQDGGNGQVTTDELVVEDANGNAGPLSAGAATLESLDVSTSVSTDELTANTGSIDSLTVTSITGDTADLSDIQSNSITTDSVVSNTGDITSIQSNSITARNGGNGSVTTDEVVVEQADGTSGPITAGAGTLDSLDVANSLTANDISATSGDINSLTVRDGGNGGVTTDSVLVEQADGTAGPITAGAGTLDSLDVANAITTTDITGETAEFTTSVVVNGRDVEGALNTIETNVSDNADAISQNSTDITTNANDISQNSSDITTNANDISALETDVSNLSTETTNLQSQIDTNASDIDTLETDVSNLQTNKADRTGDNITATTLEVTDTFILPSTL